MSTRSSTALMCSLTLSLGLAACSAEEAPVETNAESSPKPATDFGSQSAAAPAAAESPTPEPAVPTSVQQI